MKRSITLRGHRTSVSLEKAFWDCLKEIATTDKMSTTQIITYIDETRQPTDNLSSAIRIYILNYYRQVARK